jgi:hypothetical protein
VLSSWLWVHVTVQLLAVLCALGGIALAILGCGWSTMHSVTLYEPHKWMGVAVAGSALLQLGVSQLRPGRSERGHGAWAAVHHAWGRVTVIAGIGNAFLGTLLMHDYHGQPNTFWLVPLSAILGGVLLVAALLEAMRLQMQRTHRYNRKTDAMVEIWDTYHCSKKRAGGSAGSSGDASSDLCAAEAGGPVVPAGHGESGAYPSIDYSERTAGTFAGKPN